VDKFKGYNLPGVKFCQNSFMQKLKYVLRSTNIEVSFGKREG
jgi:hypothetical protein